MGLQLKRGLSDGDLAEIRQLEEACRSDEVLNPKLNWEMLKNRPAGEINDLFYDEGGRLVGFMGLYAIDPAGKEIEITGMVHPGCRRRHIGRQLMAEALELCASRGRSRILLVTEQSSVSGAGFAKAADFRYAVSEYRMRFAGHAAPVPLDDGLHLRKANRLDAPAITNIDALCFGSGESVAAETTRDDGSGGVATDGLAPWQNATYVAELEGRVIGKICGIVEKDEGYICGFGVLPEFRQRGYGRAVLNWMVWELCRQNVKTVLLEVAAENEQALHLYQRCGFVVTTVYDYYDRIMPAQT